MATALQTGRYQPISAQGEITLKGRPDEDDIKRRKAAAGNGMNVDRVFRGGELDQNHAIMPGELCFSRVGAKVEKGYSGEVMHKVFTTVAGMDFGGKSSSDEAFKRTIKFVGIAKSPDLASGTDFFGDKSLDHGFGIIGGGSYSTWNNNHLGKEIGPLQHVAWDIPDTGRDVSRELRPAPLDTGFNSKQKNVAASPFSKPLFEVVPFDPNDFRSAHYGLYAMLDSLVGRRYSDFYARGTTPLSSLEEEAGAAALGVMGILQRSNTAGFAQDASGTFTSNQIEALKSIFDPRSKQGDEAAQNWLSFMFRAGTGAFYAKADRIIGKSMGGAKVGGTLNIMLSHFKIGL